MALQVVKLLEHTVPKAVSVKHRFSSKLSMVEGDPGQFTQALMNLCLNAVDAMQGGGVLEISTGKTRGGTEREPCRPSIWPPVGMSRFA